MSFLPTEYSIPESQGSYMKLEKGDNIFRVLSSAVVGWEGWRNQKPIRWRADYKITPDVYGLLDQNDNGKTKYKHFWAFLVWNYKTKSVQVLELTQQSIMKAVKSYVDDEAYGDPKGYDIKVTREGDGFDTEYIVTPRPPRTVSPEIQKAADDSDLDLNSLFDGKENKAYLEEIQDALGGPETSDSDDPLGDSSPF